MSNYYKKIEVALTINNCLMVYKSEGCLLNRFSGEKVSLPDSEINILLELNNSPGKIFTRSYLLDVCWSGRIVTNSSLNVAMSNIRKKLKVLVEDDIEIITVPKKGYALEVKNSDNKVIKTSNTLAIKDKSNNREALVDTNLEQVIDDNGKSFPYSCAVYVLSTMITMIMLVDIVWI